MTEKTIREIFGERLRHLREQRGLSQLDLAYELGYDSTGMVSLVETGQRGMDIEKIVKATQFFDVDPNYFFKGVEIDPNSEVSNKADNIPDGSLHWTDELILGFYRLGQIPRNYVFERETEPEGWKNKRRRLEIEVHKIDEERRRIIILEEDADLWAKAEKIRKFINAVKRYSMGKKLSELEKTRLQEWINWTNQYADKIDPLCRKFPIWC